MDKKYLTKKLDEMKLAAAADWEQSNKARKNTYRTLAAAYLNWREASLLPDFLEGEYEKAGITYRAKQSNNINFRPYLKLIYGFTTPSRYVDTKVGDYDLVMVQLDREFSENPKAYQSNAVNKLVAFIEANGGISGIKEAYLSENEPPTADGEISTKDDKKLAKKKASDDELAKRGIDIVAGAEGFANVNLNRHVRADENDLVVLLCRREDDGSVTVLGTTNDAEAINVAAIHATQRNLSVIPYTIRLLAEVISTQMYPAVGKPNGKEAQKAWYRRILLDRTGIKLSQVHKLKRADMDLSDDETTNPRFLKLRNVWEDVLFSSLRSRRSVVTQCKPRVFIGDEHRSIYLKTNERYFIEGWIESGEIGLMTATPAISLQRVVDQKYIYKLATENKFNGTRKDLHFYEHGRPEDKPILKQQTVFNFFQFKPKWTCNVGVGWFEELRAEWLDKWFVTLGKNTQLKRENNAAFDLVISQTGIRITYNMDDTGLAPSHSAKAAIDFLKGVKEEKLTVRSKDLAPVLYNIADLPIDGLVAVGGDEDAIVFEFKTDCGDYKIAVPTFDPKLANSQKQYGNFERI